MLATARLSLCLLIAGVSAFSPPHPNWSARTVTKCVAFSRENHNNDKNSISISINSSCTNLKRMRVTSDDEEDDHSAIGMKLDRRNTLQTLVKFMSTAASVTVATAGVYPVGAYVYENPSAVSTVASIAVAVADDPSSSNKSPKKALSEEYLQGTAALSNMDSKAPVPESAYVKLPSGVVYADLRQGSGDEVMEGSRVNIQWVLRKSNGYFVDSSEVQNGVPFIFTVGDKKAVIEGLDEGIRGMRQGGTRRILIPPRLAYVQGLEDGLPGPLPAGYGPRQQMRRVQTIRKDVPGEYIFLEVQATRVR